MFGGWFKFCKEWWDDASDKDSILILTYESCKKVQMFMLYHLQSVESVEEEFIYTEPEKETLRSSLLYYFIKCYYNAFLHIAKVVRDVLRTNAKFELGSVK